MNLKVRIFNISKFVNIRNLFNIYSKILKYWDPADEGLIGCNSVMSGCLSWQKSGSFFSTRQSDSPQCLAFRPLTVWVGRQSRRPWGRAVADPDEATSCSCTQQPHHHSLTVILGTLVWQMHCLTVSGPLAWRPDPEMLVWPYSTRRLVNLSQVLPKLLGPLTLLLREKSSIITVSTHLQQQNARRLIFNLFDYLAILRYEVSAGQSHHATRFYPFSPYIQDCKIMFSIHSGKVWKIYIGGCKWPMPSYGAGLAESRPAWLGHYIWDILYLDIFALVHFV